MAYDAFAFENGEIIQTEAFSRPAKRSYPYLFNGKEVEMVEHCHDEPVYMGLNSEKFFKGAKNIYFKYGGVGVNFAKPLYRAGLLSNEEVIVNGRKVIPFDFILAHLPPAPKFKEEIKEILDEGLLSDTGAFVVEAYGKKDGKDVMVETHLSCPGIMESYKRSGLTAEMYQTGQCGFLFTKMFLEDKFTQHGLISSDMLTEEQIDRYLDWAAKLDITLSIEAKDVK
jgi:saccharopine dehydrogenase-like NADP-dependent oxidoreductase